MTSATGIFYGIGVGPGNPDLLTIAALKALKSVDYIFYTSSPSTSYSTAKEIISSFSDEIKGEFIALSSAMSNNISGRKKLWENNAEVILSKLTQKYNCAFITLGDPLIYSTCGYMLETLKKALPKDNIVLIPGITSFQAAASVSQTILADNDECLTIVPAFKKEIFSKKSLMPAGTTVLMKSFKTKNSIIEYIRSEKNIAESIYFSNLGLKEEKIVRELNAIEKLPEEYLSLFIIKKKKSY